MSEDYTAQIREVGPSEDLQPVSLRVKALAWSGELDTNASVLTSPEANEHGEHRRLLVTVDGEDVIGDFLATFGDNPVKGTVTVALDDGGTSTVSGVITAEYGRSGEGWDECRDPDCLCDGDTEQPWRLRVDGRDQGEVWDLWNGQGVTVMLQGYALTRHDADHPRHDPDVEVQLALRWQGHAPGSWVRMPRSEVEWKVRGGVIARVYAPGKSIVDQIAAVETVIAEVEAENAKAMSYPGWVVAIAERFEALLTEVEVEPVWRRGEGPSELELAYLRGLRGLLQSASPWLEQMELSSRKVSDLQRSLADARR